MANDLEVDQTRPTLTNLKTTQTTQKKTFTMPWNIGICGNNVSMQGEQARPDNDDDGKIL